MNKSGELSATFVPLVPVMPKRLISARGRSLHLLDKVCFGSFATERSSARADQCPLCTQ